MFSSRVLTCVRYGKMHHVCGCREIQRHTSSGTYALSQVVRNALQTATFFAAGMEANAQQQCNAVGGNMQNSPASVTLLLWHCSPVPQLDLCSNIALLCSSSHTSSGQNVQEYTHKIYRTI